MEVRRTRIARVVVCPILFWLPLLFGADQTADQLFKAAQNAERAGQIAKAYLLYSEAAAKDPSNTLYWLHAKTIREVANAQNARPAASTTADAPNTPIDPTLFGQISDADLKAAKRLLPPPVLLATPGRKDFNLRGDARALFEQVGHAFNLLVVFDSGYQPKPDLRFVIQDADYREALEALQAATGSFVVPAGDRLLLVANETPQKRTDLDSTSAVVIPVPEPFTIQEVQEIATAIRGTLDIQKLMVDTQRRMILVRDRVSKVLLAQMLIHDLMKPKAQVAIEVQLLTSDDNGSLTYGIDFPTSFPLIWVPASSNNVTTSFPSSFSNYLGFGGGHSRLALGLTSAGLFATATKALATNLINAEIVTSDGQAASLHIGDRYPVASQGYFGATPGASGQVYTPPPVFNFEDLGLVLKVTPHVHGMDEVSLEVDAEFKLLAGTALDDIPIISNRKFESKVRVREGEWAVLAGLMTASEGRTVTGLPGLSTVPFLHKDKRNRDRGETLVILKPHLLYLPPTESVTRSAWVGTETHPHTRL